MPIDLSAFDDQYTAAAPPEREAYSEIPDGKYQATLEKFELKETKTGKPMLSFQLKVLAGDHTGAIVFKNSVISPNTLDFVKSDLGTMGFAGKLSELQQPEVRMGFIGKNLEIQVKTKGVDNEGRPNRNVYVNRALTLAAGTVDQPPF